MKLPNTNKRWMPFFIEFVKFAAGFAAVIAISLFVLSITSNT